MPDTPVTPIAPEAAPSVETPVTPVPESVLEGGTVTPSAEQTVDTLAPEAPESWLPEDLRSNERLKGYKSAEELARDYAKAELAQPVPEKYELPEGVPKEFGDWAKKKKFSQDQLSSMLKLSADSARMRGEKVAKEYDAGRTELFETWGENKAAYLSDAEAVFTAIPSGDKIAKLLKESGEGKNPAVISFMYEVSKAFKEGGFLPRGKSAPVKKDVLKERYPTMYKDGDK